MIANPRYYISPLYAAFEESMRVAKQAKTEEQTKYETNKVVRKKIDKLLHENHLIQQEIDKNTTAEEKEAINKLSEVVFQKIKEIEPNFFDKIKE
jgi:predicted Holliday junction resolvase-like endonuclease